jgi:hypothetical protein
MRHFLNTEYATMFSTPDRFGVIPVFGANAILDESAGPLDHQSRRKTPFGLSDGRS